MIGSMRDRITFKGPVNTALPGAGANTSYVDIFTDWSKAEPLSSSRSLQDNQIVLQNGYRFTIRYRSSPQPDKNMLIQYGDSDYTINSIEQILDNRNRYWRITAISNE